ncbi:Shikimate dehydrogenase (NADP(+)) [Candidatus Nitrotoga sp. HW29]|uniref:shikimate dehydrogenase n=1 Tax=Candidatus Nitrotoga sp. HW29 TaxID=2886963 RepID=UPI001EF29AC8|nr:shikimate dehydrogenase [Candidatus Nitrotoga sp. HW29]CAH1905865.1 Shikimate dehydrogenase (NADP(+)) [Candidatus Nitrotoga sp. HW29]
MTDRYAVIGNPISHSKSPLIHAQFARQTGQDLIYEAISAPLDGFRDTVLALRDEGYRGMNVTVPFKFDAFQLATQLTVRAQAAQAVNTLKFGGTEIIGDNTDGAGLVADIERNLGFILQGKRVLLMGAGGAAYGVVLPLLTAGAIITVANRTEDKAYQLAALFSAHGPIQGSSYIALAGSQFDCVINATSSSLAGALPPLPRGESASSFSSSPDASFVIEKNAKCGGIFASHALAYDMMYGKETPFLVFAKEQGAARLADGLGMLVEQAAESFFLWRDIHPDTAAVIANLRLI